MADPNAIPAIDLSVRPQHRRPDPGPFRRLHHPSLTAPVRDRHLLSRLFFRDRWGITPPAMRDRQGNPAARSGGRQLSFTTAAVDPARRRPGLDALPASASASPAWGSARGTASPPGGGWGDFSESPARAAAAGRIVCAVAPRSAAISSSSGAPTGRRGPSSPPPSMSSRATLHRHSACTASGNRSFRHFRYFRQRAWCWAETRATSDGVANGERDRPRRRDSDRINDAKSGLHHSKNCSSVNN